MEAAFFAIDIIGIILLLYWSIQNDKLGPDAPTVGLFAYRETIKHPSPPTALSAGWLRIYHGHDRDRASRHSSPPDRGP